VCVCVCVRKTGEQGPGSGPAFNKQTKACVNHVPSSFAAVYRGPVCPGLSAAIPSGWLAKGRDGNLWGMATKICDTGGALAGRERREGGAQQKKQGDLHFGVCQHPAVCQFGAVRVQGRKPQE
jgi:hypothetical protein